MKITINHFATYSEAVLTNIPANFTDAQQLALMDELNVHVLVF
jgi:hypothetical protein